MINYEVQKVYVKMRKYEGIKLEAKRLNLEKDITLLCFKTLIYIKFDEKIKKLKIMNV